MLKKHIHTQVCKSLLQSAYNHPMCGFRPVKNLRKRSKIFKCYYRLVLHQSRRVRPSLIPCPLGDCSSCWRQCPLTSTNICNKPSQTDRVSDSRNLPPAWSNYLPRHNFNALHPNGCLMELCQPTQSEESMKDSFNRVCSKNMLSTKTREPQLPIHQERNTHGRMFSWFEGRISKRHAKSTALIQRRIKQVPRQHVQVSPKSLQLSAWGT